LRNIRNSFFNCFPCLTPQYTPHTLLILVIIRSGSPQI
jgi:hypothetical protein